MPMPAETGRNSRPSGGFREAAGAPASGRSVPFLGLASWNPAPERGTRLFARKQAHASLA